MVMQCTCKQHVYTLCKGQSDQTANMNSYVVYIIYGLINDIHGNNIHGNK